MRRLAIIYALLVVLVAANSALLAIDWRRGLALAPMTAVSLVCFVVEVWSS